MGYYLMIIDYFRKNFYWAVFLGIILQCAGNFMLGMQFGWLILLIGTALLLIGFAFYVKLKGWYPAWCLLALIPIIGWIALILLKNRTNFSLNESS